MSKFSKELKKIVDDGILEKDLIEESSHKTLEEILLWIRNIAVMAAVILFLVSLIIHEQGHLWKGIAYFCGAGAYVAELLLLTECFTKKASHNEMFMVYCFGPLYILLGLSYLL